MNIDQDKHKAARQYQRLAAGSITLKAAAIAEHYQSRAMQAQFMEKVLRLPQTPETRELLNELVTEIAKAHAEDLGIALEWEEPK